MKGMTTKVLLAALALALGVFALSGCGKDSDVIKIGFNLELTGEGSKKGEAAKFAAELLREDLNAKGGLEIGGKLHRVEFVYVDNGNQAQGAVDAAVKMITQDKVVAMVGPGAAPLAAKAGGACNDGQTLMVSPGAASPEAVQDRPWVFRACLAAPAPAPVAQELAAAVPDQAAPTAPAAPAAPAPVKDPAKDFAERYKAKYQSAPDEAASLTWDAARLVLQAVQAVGKVEANIQLERKLVRDTLAATKGFAPITANVKFVGTTDQGKCAAPAAPKPEPAPEAKAEVKEAPKH